VKIGASMPPGPIPPQFIGKDLSSQTPERRKEISRMGNAAPKDYSTYKYYAKVREMKKKAALGKITQKECDWFIQRVEDPEANILEIQNYLDEIKKMCNNPNQNVLLAQTMIQLHKAHHGEKVKTENLNMNINISIEEWEKRLLD
jgi:hypothetical protein